MTSNERLENVFATFTHEQLVRKCASLSEALDAANLDSAATEAQLLLGRVLAELEPMAAKNVRLYRDIKAFLEGLPVETNGVRESALQRVIDRHVRWRKTAIGFLRQVVDGRGSEDEWPALAEFLERSDSRMAERSVEKRAACDERDMKPLLSAPLTVEDRRVWRQVERRMVGKWVRAVLMGGNHLDHLSYTGIYAKADFCDAELMLNVTLYPHMLVTALAQEMNPNFKMPRPLARMAGKFCRVFSAT